MHLTACTLDASAGLRLLCVPTPVCVQVIMGGNSASLIEHAPDVGPRVARWKGELILEV